MNELSSTLLVVDTRPGDCDQVQELLAGAGFSVSCQDDLSSALDDMAGRQHDLYIVGYQLKEGDGISFIQQAREKGCQQPIILVGSKDSKEISQKAIQAGAVNYLLKTRLTDEVLNQAVGFALQEQRVRQQLEIMAKQNAQLSSAISNSKYGTVIVDPTQPDNPIIFSNPAFTFITGYSAQEAYGKNCRFIQGKDTDPIVVAKMREAIAAKEPFGGTLLNYRKDGTPFWNEVAITPIFNDQGKLIHYVGLQCDVTSRKQAEEALLKANDELENRIEQQTLEVERQRHMLDAIFAASQDSIAVFNEKKQYTYANPAALYALGMEMSNLYGKQVKEAGTLDISLASKINQEIQQALDSGESITSESPFTTAEGQVKYIEYVISPIPNKQGAIIISRDITERKESERLIRRLAYSDILTSLPNRAYLERELEQSVTRAALKKEKTAVFFLDLDRFKNINDTMGHPVGDQVLREVAIRLKHQTEGNGTLGRLSGDEFMFILPRPKGSLARWCQQLLDAFNEPIIIDGQDFQLSATIGAATCPTSGADVPSLLKNADIALYEAKAAGRGSYRIHTHNMGHRASHQLKLENGLGQAVQREQFVVYYQPIINTRSGKINKAEALIRWNHPELGLITPSSFIHLAEESGSINLLGSWIISEVVKQIRQWQEAGLPHIKVAVNLSPKQLNRNDLVETVLEAVTRNNLEPSCLELEITETTAVQDVALTVTRLQELRRLGIRTSIDDFGSGYASLNYLKRLPIDTIKIDKIFVRDCATSSQDAAILKAVIDLAHSLKLKVVAEGVEDNAQLAMLLNLGCDGIQGYLFGRPLPAEQFRELLENSETYFSHQLLA